MGLVLVDGILEAKLVLIFVKYSLNISQLDSLLVVSELLLFLKQRETVLLSHLFIANLIVFQIYLEVFNVLSSFSA